MIRHFEEIIRSSGDLICLLDERGRIGFINEAFDEVLGAEPGACIGQKVADLLITPFREEFEARLVEIQTGLAGPETGPVRRVVLRRKNGGVFPASLSIGVVRYHGRLFFTAVFRDLTKIMDVERQLELRAFELRRSNAELERFTGGVAQALRTPLASMEAKASRLEASEGLTRIRRGLERLRDLQTTLSAFSEIGPESSVSAFEMEEIVDEVRCELDDEGSLGGPGSPMSIERGQLPRLKGVPSQIKVLMKNLIGNAVKFRRENVTPMVLVTARDAGSHWLIMVEDNGVGIPRKRFSEIFRMSSRLHSRGEYTGWGLGLALCRKVAQSHGGSIDVDSVLGKGSTFTVTLPKD